MLPYHQTEKFDWLRISYFHYYIRVQYETALTIWGPCILEFKIGEF